MYIYIHIYKVMSHVAHESYVASRESRFHIAHVRKYEH